jgi:hypothetical protein
MLDCTRMDCETAIDSALCAAFYWWKRRQAFTNEFLNHNMAILSIRTLYWYLLMLPWGGYAYMFQWLSHLTVQCSDEMRWLQASLLAW